MDEASENDEGRDQGGGGGGRRDGRGRGRAQPGGIPALGQQDAVVEGAAGVDQELARRAEEGVLGRDGRGAARDGPGAVGAPDGAAAGGRSGGALRRKGAPRETLPATRPEAVLHLLGVRGADAGDGARAGGQQLEGGGRRGLGALGAGAVRAGRTRAPERTGAHRVPHTFSSCWNRFSVCWDFESIALFGVIA